jgi:hypothetical protein
VLNLRASPPDAQDAEVGGKSPIPTNGGRADEVTILNAEGERLGDSLKVPRQLPASQLEMLLFGEPGWRIKFWSERFAGR